MMSSLFFMLTMLMVRRLVKAVHLADGPEGKKTREVRPSTTAAGLDLVRISEFEEATRSATFGLQHRTKTGPN